MATSINRADYAAMFGPTTGDKVRLADTDLFIEVEDDRIEPASHPGDCRVEFFRFCDHELFVFAVYVASVRKNIEARILA